MSFSKLTDIIKQADEHNIAFWEVIMHDDMQERNVTDKESFDEIKNGFPKMNSLKTTLNMTLVDIADFNIDKLKKYFDKEYFFIKLSPINENDVSIANNMGTGVIEGQNII